MSAKNHPDMILKKLRQHINGCQHCTVALELNEEVFACELGRRMRNYLDESVDLNRESGTHSFQVEFINVFGFWPSRN